MTLRKANAKSPPRVALFVTCLVDLFRPNVGFASIKLLTDAGCEVDVPKLQTCCGQPAFNSGDESSTREIAKQVIDAFSGFDYVVLPSGSCCGMFHEHYPALFQDDAKWRQRAVEFARKCYELTTFLCEILGDDRITSRFTGECTYHDSCSGLRELGISQQPRQLLAKVKGLKIKEMEDSNVCCGFGGTFCVKYPEISVNMVDNKIKSITATQANTLLGGDLGCLLNIAGRLSRQGSTIKVFHVAEVLADMTDVDDIGANTGST